MRDYKLEITEEETSSSVSFDFDNDGCTHLAIRNLRARQNGELQIISVVVKVDDVKAIIEFMEIFLHEHELQKEKEKLGA